MWSLGPELKTLGLWDGFRKTQGLYLEVLTVRIVVSWGLFLGRLFWETPI